LLLPVPCGNGICSVKICLHSLTNCPHFVFSESVFPFF
jgi:hypothetical protein